MGFFESKKEVVVSAYHHYFINYWFAGPGGK
jgi:hypothetical protein